MSLSRRSLLAGLATIAAVPAAQCAAVDDVVTVRTVPPVAGWPDWVPIDPAEPLPTGDLWLTADSVQYLEPAPGYRFRRADAGLIIHEPDRPSIQGTTSARLPPQPSRIGGAEHEHPEQQDRQPPWPQQAFQK
jgi:hypothetical protein